MDQPLPSLFPAIDAALSEPNGLLAVGGELSTERLIDAYRHGIFPWFETDQPVLWWSPDPRAVIEPGEVHVSRSLRKTLRNGDYQLGLNSAFEQVIQACASSRKNSKGTWINDDMLSAYTELHKLGVAHSIEVYQQGQLIGGLYGVVAGHLFSGESMFHRQNNASKIAFVAICKYLEHLGWPLLDCQINNIHLESLGVKDIPRALFKQFLPAYQTDAEQIDNTVPPSWDKLPWQTSSELEASLQ